MMPASCADQLPTSAVFVVLDLSLRCVTIGSGVAVEGRLPKCQTPLNRICAVRASLFAVVVTTCRGDQDQRQHWCRPYVIGYCPLVHDRTVAPARSNVSLFARPSMVRRNTMAAAGDLGPICGPLQVVLRSRPQEAANARSEHRTTCQDHPRGARHDRPQTSALLPPWP